MFCRGFRLWEFVFSSLGLGGAFLCGLWLDGSFFLGGLGLGEAFLIGFGVLTGFPQTGVYQTAYIPVLYYINDKANIFFQDSWLSSNLTPSALASSLEYIFER